MEEKSEALFRFCFVTKIVLKKRKIVGNFVPSQDTEIWVPLLIGLIGLIGLKAQ